MEECIVCACVFVCDSREGLQDEWQASDFSAVKLWTHSTRRIWCTHRRVHCTFLYYAVLRPVLLRDINITYNKYFVV